MRPSNCQRHRSAIETKVFGHPLRSKVSEKRIFNGVIWMYHSFSQILQEEAKSARGVRHGVCTVKYDECIEGIIQLYFSGNSDPVCVNEFLSELK